MIRTGWSPSVRLFEAAACGTPIISDRWDGLSDLLPIDDAILVVDHADDVFSVLSGIGDATRDRIGRRARDIVLTNHSGAARGLQLEHHIRAIRSSATTHIASLSDWFGQ
jgi:spore maturation protein CgeB